MGAVARALNISPDDLQDVRLLNLKRLNNSKFLSTMAGSVIAQVVYKKPPAGVTVVSVNRIINRLGSFKKKLLPFHTLFSQDPSLFVLQPPKTVTVKMNYLMCLLAWNTKPRLLLILVWWQRRMFMRGVQILSVKMERSINIFLR